LEHRVVKRALTRSAEYREDLGGADTHGAGPRVEQARTFNHSINEAGNSARIEPKRIKNLIFVPQYSPDGKKLFKKTSNRG
jgi:hypothetical protein